MQTLTYNEDALLFSVEVDERASPLDNEDNPTLTTPLFGYPLHSHSSLILIRSKLGGVVEGRPDDLISGSIEIEKVNHNMLPIAIVYTHIDLGECIHMYTHLQPFRSLLLFFDNIFCLSLIVGKALFGKSFFSNILL